MKLAIIGSRGILNPNISMYISEKPTEIVSGGAKGVDSYAEEYARDNGIPIKVFKPDYKAHKQGAPIRRNELICQYCDEVLAFWDGKSHGTKYTIDYSKKIGKKVKVVII